MKTIWLTRGYKALVSDRDYPLVSKYKWSASVKQSGHVYAKTNIPTGKTNPRQRSILMHRLILGLLDTPWVLIDHKNGNGLDNTRINLRVASHSQNMRNRKGNANSRWPKGIRFRNGRWEARIKLSGALTHLGCFRTEQLACNAYNKAAAKEYGSFYRPTHPRSKG